MSSGPTIHLRPDVYEALKAAADERGLPIAWLGCRLLAEALDDLIPVNEFTLTKESHVPRSS